MIEYTADKWGIFFAFDRVSNRGSVFPKSFGFALACSIVSVICHQLLHAFDLQEKVQVGDKGTTVLGMFTFVLGFLLVFRTQQAYSRWWEGGTLLQELRGEWFNAYSSLLAFASTDVKVAYEVMKFQHRLARLFSMLYGAGLAQVSSLDRKEFEVIDLEDFDIESLRLLDCAHDPCEVALQWIQRLIGEADRQKLIVVAPPILSRVYNQLGNGIVKLNNARKITNFPIPFPFAQMITVMLLMHWAVAVVICSTSIESPIWAALLSFSVIISFWSINFIALELEDPFGDDPNDLPMQDMQADLNASLKELLKNYASSAPEFDFNVAYHSLVHLSIVDYADKDPPAKHGRRLPTAGTKERRLHDSVKQNKVMRKLSAFRDAVPDLAIVSEELQGTWSLLSNGAPPPSAAPAPAAAPKKVAEQPIAAPPPAEKTQAAAASSSSCPPVLNSSTGGGCASVPSAIDPELCNKIEGHLTRVVSELESIADSQAVLYRLHCDFWGLLSAVFQRMPPAGAVARQFPSSMFDSQGNPGSECASPVAKSDQVEASPCARSPFLDSKSDPLQVPDGFNGPGDLC